MSNVNITAGSGTVISTDTVTLDSSNVQNLQPVKVVGGVLTRTPLPALGTAGAASTDVLTVQGIASGTVLPSNVSQVGGSAVALGAALSAASIPVVLSTDGTVIGPTTETAPVSDTAASGLNGRLQRIAQRLTTIIGLLPAALGAGGGLKVEGVGTAGSPLGGVVTVQAPSTGIVPGFAQSLVPADGGPRTVVELVGTNNSTPYPMAIHPFLFNGTALDEQRSNTDNTLLVSGAYTTSQTLADQTNHNARGLQVVLDVTTPGTGSITLEIDGKDPTSGKYYPLLTGVAVTTAVTNVYRVYPGLTAVANATANDILPRTWRVKVTANNANSVTYSVGASVIL